VRLMGDDPFSIDPGLCRRCRWMREIASSRGARFTLCERSFAEPGYRKYPILPVLACSGFERVDPGQGRSTS